MNIIQKLLVRIGSKKQKIKLLEEHTGELNIIEIAHIINSIDNAENDLNDDYIEKLDYISLKQLINNINDERKRSNLILRCRSRFRFKPFDLSQLINKINSPEIKMELVKELQEDLESKDIKTIFSSISIEELRKYMEVETDQIFLYTLINCSNPENRTELIKQYKKKLRPDHLVNLINTIKEEKRVDLIEECKEEIGKDNWFGLLKNINNISIRIKLIKKYADKFEITAIENLIPDKQQFNNIIEECKEKFTGWDIYSFIKKQKEEKIPELIEKYIEQISDHLFNLINENITDNDEKLRLIRKYKDRLKSYNIRELFENIIKDNEQLIKLIAEFKDRLESDDLKKLIKEVTEFQNEGKINAEERVVLLNEYWDMLDPDDIYDLLKDNETVLFELIDKCQDKLSKIKKELFYLIKSINNPEQRKKILIKCKNTIEKDDLITLIEEKFNDSDKLTLIEECIDLLDEKEIGSLIRYSINSDEKIDDKIIQLIDRCKEKLGSSLAKLINKIKDEDKRINKIKEYRNQIEDEDLCWMLSNLNEENMDKLILEFDLKDSNLLTLICMFDTGDINGEKKKEELIKKYEQRLGYDCLATAISLVKDPEIIDSLILQFEEKYKEEAQKGTPLKGYVMYLLMEAINQNFIDEYEIFKDLIHKYREEPYIAEFIEEVTDEEKRQELYYIYLKDIDKLPAEDLYKLIGNLRNNSLANKLEEKYQIKIIEYIEKLLNDLIIKSKEEGKTCLIPSKVLLKIRDLDTLERVLKEYKEVIRNIMLIVLPRFTHYPEKIIGLLEEYKDIISFNNITEQIYIVKCLDCVLKDNIHTNDVILYIDRLKKIFTSDEFEKTVVEIVNKSSRRDKEAILNGIEFDIRNDDEEVR